MLSYSSSRGTKLRERPIMTVAALLLLFFSTPISIRAQDGEILQWRYRRGGQQARIAIDTHEVAVVFADTSSAHAWAETRDIVLSESSRSRIVRVKLENSGPAGEVGVVRDPDALWELATRALGDIGNGRLGLFVWPGAALDTSARRPETTPAILTARFIVRLHPGREAEIEALTQRSGASATGSNPFRPNERYFEAPPGRSALTLSNQYDAHPATEWAQPDFMVSVAGLSGANDEFFDLQWYLDNSGVFGAKDADIDAPSAWEVGCGQHTVVVGVIDDGFDRDHDDLVDMVEQNEGEEPGNGIDDDCNGVIDDRYGWSFRGCGSLTSTHDDTCDRDVLTCGSPTFTPLPHGTISAGAIAAKHNSEGLAGVCPCCKVVLAEVDFVSLELPAAVDSYAELSSLSAALDYVQSRGASIISNSWKLRLDEPSSREGPTLAATVVESVQQAVATGTTVVLGMTSTGLDPGMKGCRPEGVDDCNNSLLSLEAVIAVSATDSKDSRAWSGYGNCMSVVAPTSGPGASEVAGVDVAGDAGLNKDKPGACAVNDLQESTDYTLCASGTSFATPLVAGTAGLVLSHLPQLEPLEVKRLIQDTADRVEPDLAEYDPQTGRSSHPSCNNEEYPSSHGSGRINAYEATLVASRGGVDAMVRDGNLDWGNTEQPTWFLYTSTRRTGLTADSPDIRVDAGDPVSSPSTSAEFEAVTEGALQPGLNTVHVRVRNRGPHPVSDLSLCLLYSEGAELLPNLDPSVSIQTFCNPVDDWQPARCLSSDRAGLCGAQSLPYSGSSVAMTGDDAALIFTFQVDIAQPSGGAPIEPTLLAVVSAPGDTLFDSLVNFWPTAAIAPKYSAAELVPRSNNLALEARGVIRDPAPAGTVVTDLDSSATNPSDALDSSVLLTVEAPPTFSVTWDQSRKRLMPGSQLLLPVRVERPAGSSGRLIVTRRIWVGDDAPERSVVNESTPPSISGAIEMELQGPPGFAGWIGVLRYRGPETDRPRPQIRIDGQPGKNLGWDIPFEPEDSTVRIEFLFPSGAPSSGDWEIAGEAWEGGHEVLSSRIYDFTGAPP